MIAFLITCVLVEITPGPNMATLAALSLAHGRKAGLAAVAGVALGLLIIGVLAAAGLAAIVSENRTIYEVLRWGGMLYLLWLAYETWRGDGADDEGFRDGQDLKGLFLRGLITNLLNPKAAVFYIAVLPGFIDPASGSALVSNLVLVAIYVMVATVIHAGIVIGAARVRPILTQGVGLDRVRKALALGLVAIALWLFYSTRLVA